MENLGLHPFPTHAQRQDSDAPGALAGSATRLTLDRLELGAAVVMALGACLLHLEFWRRAGGLWRDEVVSFNVAMQPTLGAVHDAARYDSFPSFFHYVLRAWQGAGGGGSDVATRGLGLCIGLCVLAAVWWSARALGQRLPLVSLALLGVSGLCIRTTDAIRAYGVGILFSVLCFGLLWRVVLRPSRLNVALAGIAAVLSVQSLYQNAFLLGAMCFGAVVVCAQHRLYRQAALVVGIGATAALSLTFYIDAMQHMSDIKPLIRTTGLGSMLAVAWQALRDGSNLRLMLWLVLIVGFFGVAGRLLSARKRGKDVADDMITYVFASAALALAGFFTWLKVLGFPTQAWYYVPPMALLALAIDAGWPALLPGNSARIARLMIVGAAAIAGLFGAAGAVQVRQTNVDLIATKLEQLVQPGDFILVDQWYNGATFNRYWRAPTPWATVPPLEDQSLQRLDLFKRYMQQADPNAAVEQTLMDTLQAGHRVWLVGGLPLSQKGKPVPRLPPAPQSQFGWDHDAYSYVWARHAGEVLQARAQKAIRVDLPLQSPVNEFENLPLWVVEGWRKP
jgi:hypothetical protein